MILTGHRSTPLRKAVKPGSSAATWSNIKYNSNSIIDQDKVIADNNHKSNTFNKVVKVGENGEIFISYGNILEVWDWEPSSLNLEKNDELNGLYLVASLTDLNEFDEIINFEVIETNSLSNSYRILLILKQDSEIKFLIKSIGQYLQKINQSLILPPLIYGNEPFKVKCSKKFIGISTNEGSLTIFNLNNNQPSLNLNVKVINGEVLFDIQGRFLIYVPVESKDRELTKLNLPIEKKSIYLKLFKNLSNLTINGLINLKNKNFKNYLFDLINDNKYNDVIVLIDLENNFELTCFKPPNGISNISLSPFNNQLISINKNGNEIYKFDFTKFNKNVELIDFQIKGIKNSIIKKINWFSNTSYQILSNNGTIHSFNSENWILSNLKFHEIGNTKSFLIGINKNEIFKIKLNGESNNKLIIPSKAIQKSLLPDYIPTSSIQSIIFKKKIIKQKNSLSQVEIDTCLIGDLLKNNPKFKFNPIDLSNEQFWNLYKNFGNEFKVNEVQINEDINQVINAV